jgi:hypothetical protein
MTALGLPQNLVKLIREGGLNDAIDAAYAELDRLNTLLDAWEAANPAAARLAPWFEGREAGSFVGRAAHAALGCDARPRGQPHLNAAKIRTLRN